MTGIGPTLQSEAAQISVGPGDDLRAREEPLAGGLGGGENARLDGLQFAAEDEPGFPSDASRQVEELQAHCRSHLAGYKAPRALYLVDEVRRSPAGKPDYRWASAVVSETTVDR